MSAFYVFLDSPLLGLSRNITLRRTGANSIAAIATVTSVKAAKGEAAAKVTAVASMSVPKPAHVTMCAAEMTPASAEVAPASTKTTASAVW